MKIVIAGSSGFIGTALKAFLQKQGHQMHPLIRSQGWNPAKCEVDLQLLEDSDAVINLCGENIASGRWTDEKKRRIFESRINSTKTLAECFVKLKNPPKVLVNASAMGYYGDRGDEIVDESSLPGHSFISQVCQEWERATSAAADAGVRVVSLRIGLVLSPEGGAMKKMLLPFKLGLGGVIGSGKQWISWIALDDLLKIFSHALTDDNFFGPINAVSPHPVTNREFTKTLGIALRRPTLFPLPAFVARLMLGREMADSTLLSSTRVEPKVLASKNFVFDYPTLNETFQHILNPNCAKNSRFR